MLGGKQPQRKSGEGKSASKSSTARKGSVSTERELKRLRRVDLLELLLDEIRNNESNVEKVQELTELTNHLKEKLDEKDAQIESLKAKLDEKDEAIEKLQARNEMVARSNGTIDVNEMLRVQRLAVLEYLRLKGEEKSDMEAGAPTGDDSGE